ncbi:isoquinoline 1-oxidoreductase, alpha subunit [Sphingobium sp. AP50]|uniref:(2Fe-2S)-binding protein n=1 Tax=Sphingobium sp. AP50 TaxID=1884369 RepID=UPI0008B2CA09|nr:(2Fe-2S)-binding protein [Sphingobium sp. AP50]SEJ81547.1 isoquinoline 1-oxidoreductase, alpha subunit [Sphingobium sp. AP50]
MVNFEVNGKQVMADIEEGTPLLWVLRDDLGLTGTKFGCGIAQCGACTVHVDGEAKRSCLLPVEEVEGKHVTTIEGLGGDGLHPIQQLWIKHQVPQCGYCQSGMIMATAALFHENQSPSDEEILARMTNICRCGTYPRIRAAIEEARAGAKKVLAA